MRPGPDRIRRPNAAMTTPQPRAAIGGFHAPACCAASFGNFVAWRMPDRQGPAVRVPSAARNGPPGRLPPGLPAA